MLKQQAKLLIKIAVAVDAMAIVAAYFVAFYLENASNAVEGIGDYSWLLLFVLPVWIYLSFRFHLYASLRTRTLKSISVDVLKVHLLGGLAFSSVIYILEPQGFSREVLLNFIIASLSFVIFDKFLQKVFLSYVRRKGYNFRNILVVGCNERVLQLTRLIENQGEWGLRIAGFLQVPGEDSRMLINGYKNLGRLDDLVELCKTMAIDEVVFSVPIKDITYVEDHVRDMEQMGVTVRMVLDFDDLTRSRREFSLFHGCVPMLTFYPRSFDCEHLFVKRCIDVAGAVAGLFITGFFFPFVALAIKLDSPGPLLFGQERVGERGRTFRCWKFRSMYADAEERKKELLHLNELNGAIFKIKKDPRITRVGAFLRKTSLDELPQFWNVLKGEMSLVGTRPPTPEEVATYENWHRKRICIKPGMTGLWQVSGRNEILDFDEVARLDIEYIEKWSLWLDIKIILKTFNVVLFMRGSA